MQELTSFEIRNHQNRLTGNNYMSVKYYSCKNGHAHIPETRIKANKSRNQKSSYS
jgi:hypothetical protein